MNALACFIDWPFMQSPGVDGRTHAEASLDMVVCVFEVTLSDAFTHAGNCISAQLGACVRRRERSSHRGLFPLLRAHVRLPAAGEREGLVCCSMDSSRWPWLFTSSVQGANKIPTIRWRTQLVKEAEPSEYPTACPPAPWMGLPPWCSRPASCRRTCADSRRAGGFHRISLC